MSAIKAFRLSHIALLSLVLSACSTPARVSEQVDTRPVEHEPELAQQIQLSCSQQHALDLKLDLFEQALQQADFSLAQQVQLCVQSHFDKQQASIEQQAWLSLFQAQLALETQSAEHASQILQQHQQQQDLSLLPLTLQNQLLLLEAKTLEQQQKYLAAAQQRIFNNNLLEPQQQSQNLASIWADLLALDVSELEQALLQAKKNQLNPELLGWLELAAIIKTHNDNLDTQITALNTWQAQWPTHPAHEPLPSGIDDLYQMAAGRAQHIAVLLPQTGRGSKASKAIQQGFLAAYYQQSNYQPIIRFYNTDQSAITELLEQAVNEGAEVIIGPLLKENIIQLQSLPSLPVPVLALNSLVQNLETQNLYQISLAVEDEAEQAAEFALRNNKQRALILTSNKTSSQRAGEAFEQHWLANDAQVSAIEQYQNKDMKTSIRRALEIDKSAARYYSVRQVTQLDIEAIKPHRRRQDIDVVFLAASHSEAKRLKPLLNHYRSFSIPVYATSKVHLDNKKEHDLNNIHFTEIPWLLNPSDPYHQILNSDKTKASTQRLQALGLDSFNLFPRLSYLQRKNHIIFFGRSGDYQMQNGVLFRHLDWAKYHYGKVRAVKKPAPRVIPKTSNNTVVESNNSTELQP